MWLKNSIETKTNHFDAIVNVKFAHAVQKVLIQSESPLVPKTQKYVTHCEIDS